MLTNPAPAKAAPVALGTCLLTAAEFHRLADFPSKVDWFVNMSYPIRRHANNAAVGDFTHFAGTGPTRGVLHRHPRPSHRLARLP